MSRTGPSCFAAQGDHERRVQDGGQSTAAPADDAYHPVLQSGALYTVSLLTASPPCQTVGGGVTVMAVISAPDGVLLTFRTDLGDVAPRAVIGAGREAVELTSSFSGTAHVSATARGFGGAVQGTATVTFTAPVSFPIYLPLVWEQGEARQDAPLPGLPGRHR